jgi:hypothetical protein
MDDRDCFAHYPFVVVRIACRVCSRRGSYRLARLAAKYSPEISLRDVPDRFSYDCLWRAEARSERAGKAPAACICRTLISRDRRTGRQGMVKLRLVKSA